MSMASGHDVRQYRQTPDSVRNSYLHLAPGNANNASRNGTPPVEKDGDMFRYERLRAFAKYFSETQGPTAYSFLVNLVLKYQFTFNPYGTYIVSQ